MQRCLVRARAVSVALAAAILPGCRSVPEAVRPLHRAVWIDRWDWRTRDDIEKAMEDCRNAGFTAVLFQVRGDGTALWRSRLEVWSEKFAFRDPGFDPLQVAVEAAHARGLQCHAWLNALPGWAGEKPPADPRQLWLAQPGWFLQTRNGDRQKPGAGKYLTLNPCLPEVRRYVADLCREIASNYRVDGVHVDYIRFPDAEQGAAELGCDARTLSLFTATGARLDDHDRLEQWQAECVTRLVEECGQAVRSARSDRLALTAAVFADLRVAHEKVLQDWPDWCRRKLVDAVMPMNYAADDGVFWKHCNDAVKAARGVPVVMGVGLYKTAGPDQAVGQLDAAVRAGAFGVAVFSYRTMFGAATSPTPAPATAKADAKANAKTAAARPTPTPPPDTKPMRQQISAWLAAHAR